MGLRDGSEMVVSDVCVKGEKKRHHHHHHKNSHRGDFREPNFVANSRREHRQNNSHYWPAMIITINYEDEESNEIKYGQWKVGIWCKRLNKQYTLRLPNYQCYWLTPDLYNREEVKSYLICYIYLFYKCSSTISNLEYSI